MSNAPSNPTEQSIEVLRLQERYRLLGDLVNALRCVLLVASTAIPLWVVAWMVDDLAGKRTGVTLGLTFTVGVIVSAATVSIIAMLRRGREQAEELQRLRRENECLRAGNAELREQLKTEATASG